MPGPNTSVLESLSAVERELAPAAPAPTTSGAMKAVLTDDRFSDPNWIYERKLDGIRCIAIRAGATVKLLSRNDLSQNDRWPELVEALEQEECDQFVIDGEVVAFDGSETSFARLVERAEHYVPVYYYV
ncbi:MAG: non-homologous end-joining DNA ligase, partial [Solirubrobacteraceae bacterium]